MSLLFADSFDELNLSDTTGIKWTSITTGNFASNNPTPSIGAFGRNSTNGLRFTAGTLGGSSWSFVQKTLAPTSGTAIVGFAYKANAPCGANRMGILDIRDAGTAQVTLAVNADYTLSVCRGGSGGTVLGTTTFALTSGSFAYIELKVFISDTVGTVDLYVNGVSRLSLTAQDTKFTANTTWNQVSLGVNVGLTSSSPANSTHDFDDVYVFDGAGTRCNNVVGDVRVALRTATAAGNSTGWTPSTGSNWQNIDDAQADGDSTYNSTNTTGAKDLFVIQDLPVSGVTVHGVQVCIVARKEDAGVASITSVVRQSGVEADGAELFLATTYECHRNLLEVNPVTGAAWTEGDFNADEFGYKKVS